MALWEIEIQHLPSEVDREAARIVAGCQRLRLDTIRQVRTARSFLLQGELDEATAHRAALSLLVDSVVEKYALRPLPAKNEALASERLLNVLFRPGVTDNTAYSTHEALKHLGFPVSEVATCRKYWINADVDPAQATKLANKLLKNDAIEHIVSGPLPLTTIALGKDYRFALKTQPLLNLNDEELISLSRQSQLSLSLVEMRTIQQHFRELGREPTDAELETVAQTWSEHCSHKTLAGRIHYRDEAREIQFEKMLKETIFAATQEIRRRLGDNDWCVSVFRDNAGVVTFNDQYHVCIKVETHNRPSALEPYGGANTGLGGVIRDSLGTGLGAKPIANTDVFCFAPPDTPMDTLPPGILHPEVVFRGVVSGVRDYGNRMGIPTVNGAVYFDERYLGNPLVYCGNIALIPAGKTEKQALPGDYIVTVGGRTGLDGIHGATFSSAELTEHSETISGGAVQIGNAITEKMVTDALLTARDKELFHAITDCGAGGFSSAVGEMGAEIGAEVWLEKAPLKYAGLNYTEIWISEAQERMVLAVPPKHWEEFQQVCVAEGVEATVIGQFRDDHRLILKYQGNIVADMAMEFLHDGRPPVIREAVYSPPKPQPLAYPSKPSWDDDLKKILGSLNVCSKEWIIRQYDHEVQAGSVIKPLVGAEMDGPSDAAVVRPVLDCDKGVVIACGMNPRLGDLDPYWMAAGAIDEAVRNCVAVGANPERIAILDNFCWGNTDDPETLGTLVRAALGCQDTAVAFGTPFISGKDSLKNKFVYKDQANREHTIQIPPSLLITALGQVGNIRQTVTMDLKAPGNKLYLVGVTREEMGGSHWNLVNGVSGGHVPRVDLEAAPKIFRAMHAAITGGCVRACHDLSEGGLAVALAEMAFAGGMGVKVDLTQLATAANLTEPAVLLFSESHTRFVVEVPEKCVADFERIFQGLPHVLLGETAAEPIVHIQGPQGQTWIHSDCATLKACWQRPLAWE